MLRLLETRYAGGHLKAFMRCALMARCSAGLAIVLSLPQIAAAQCFLQQPDVASVHSYLLAFTDALASVNSIPEDDGKPASDNVEAMVRFQQARAEFKCAESAVAPFQKSPIEAVSVSARAATVAFSELANVQAARVKLLATSLNEVADGTFKPGTAAETAAQLTVRSGEAGQMMLTATVAATLAAVELEPATGLMSRLAMTGKQRDEILTKLRSTFGGVVTKGLQAGQSRLVGAAATLYGVLSDSRRSTRP